MKLAIWGSRGSIASAGPDTVRYGGNTSCAQVIAEDGTTIILDAGTGIRRLGTVLTDPQRPMHILLSHLHLDHIQGLGFFAPLFRTDSEIHIWGPPSMTADLRTRLTAYLSPPLFPVRIRDLQSQVEFHDAGRVAWMIGGLRVRAASILHPGPTLGYRIEDADGRALVYMPDHEPALGGSDAPRWTSGLGLAANADLLVHDAQYTDDEYRQRVGWGHSSVRQTVTFAKRAGVRQLALFHHDPAHDDQWLDRLVDEAREDSGDLDLSAAQEGVTYSV
jgi:phosphoribosyl 1,2-cyclic phosphodiesterase